MTTDLTYAPDTWQDWSSLAASERKLRAAKAIQGENHDDLWLMTLAYLQFKGKKARVSVSIRSELTEEACLITLYIVAAQTS